MLLKKLDRGVYEKEVIKSGGLALLCFFQNCISHGETVIAIDELSRQFEFVRFYTAEEEALGFFFGKFQFLGTPVFIFFANGFERGRLMGTASIERLSVFIEKNIGKANEQWQGQAGIKIVSRA
ncbi:MAG: hypothetical protein HY885_00715 [Deltaproteobacteria bacterium]|nr:hypothetical protein [Deltaproteobacteria bacterium]